MTLQQALARVAEAQRTGDYRGALELLLKSTGLRPGNPNEWMELAKRLVYFNETQALVKLGRSALQKSSWSAPAEADLAALISMVGEQDVALKLLERAVAIAGPNPDWIYNRSQIRQYRGEYSQAESDLRTCLRRNPRHAKSHWALSKLGVAVDDAEIDALRQLIQQVPQHGMDAAYLGFALFAHLDRRGQADAAWTALMAACRAKRENVRYDSAKTLAYLRALGNWSPVAAAPAARAPVQPIFVVGMHRTGTSLLERILGGHSRVAQGGELYDFPAQLRWSVGSHFAGASDPVILDRAAKIDFPDVGQRYLAHVAWRAAGKSFLIDKLPSNFINLGYLQQALPDAKIIHIHRAPMDTCFSNLKELFANACAYSYDLQELGDFYLAYRALMQHWREAMPGFVLDVSYEELTSNPEQEAHRILAFCGLDWEPACLETGSRQRSTNTASSAQVREPIHRRNIGAWQHYSTYLDPLRRRLGA